MIKWNKRAEAVPPFVSHTHTDYGNDYCDQFCSENIIVKTDSGGIDVARYVMNLTKECGEFDCAVEWISVTDPDENIVGYVTGWIPVSYIESINAEGRD